MALEMPADALAELPELRTINSKTWLMPRGRRKMTIAQSPQHVPLDVDAFKRGDSVEWADVDTSWATLANTAYVRNAWYHCDVRLDEIAWTYYSKMSGAVSVELTHIGVRSIDELSLNFDIGIEGNKLTFYRILPELDLEFEAKPNGLFFSKVLHGPTAPRDFGWDIEWSDGSPLNINTDTQGRDNHGRGDANREGEGKRGVQRKIEMRHQVQDQQANKLDHACHFNEWWTGRTFKRDEQGRRVLDDECVYPVWVDQDITEPIAAGQDDGYQTFPTVYFYNGFLQSFFGYYGTNSYYPFFRFITVNIPQGALILDATLTVNQNSLYNAGNTMVVRGNDVDNAAVWANPGNLPSNATATTASASVVLTSVGLKTIDVTSIIQEIVDRSGWVAGNALALWFDTPSTVGVNDGGYIEMFEDPIGTDEPLLELTFGAPIDTRKTLCHIWRMEEASGTREDSVGQVDLTVTSGSDPGNTTGRVDNGIPFTSANGHLVSDLLTRLDPTGGEEFSCSLWVNFDNAAGTEEILLQYGSATTKCVDIRRLASGVIEATVINNTPTTYTLTGTTVTAASTWYFIAVTFMRNQRATLYLDGVVEGTPATVADVRWFGDFAAPRLVIGSGDGGVSDADAVIDEVSFDDAALQVGDVLDLYATGSGVNRASTYRADLHTSLAQLNKFEESTGTRFDSIGSYDFDSIFNESGSVPAIVGNGGNFDGSMYWFENTTPVWNAVEEVTIAIWVRFDNATGDQEVIFRVDPPTAIIQALLDRNASGFFDAHMYDSALTSNQVISATTAAAGTWFLCVLVYKRNGYHKLYINGALDGPEVAVADLATPDGSTDPRWSVGIPSNLNTAIQIQDAVIDELSVWLRPLTGGQVEALYNNGGAVNLIGVGRALVHLYQLDEDGGTRADAISGLDLDTITSDSALAVPGVIGDALDADSGFGVASSSGSSPVSGSPNITITSWVRFNNAPGSIEVVVSCGGHQCFIERTATGQFRAVITDEQGSVETLTGTTVTAASTTYFVALTRDRSGFLRLYVDGAEEGVAVAASDFALETWTGAHVSVGARSTNTENVDAEFIDEVSIHDEALIAQEIDSIYNGGNGVNQNPAAGGMAGIARTMAAGWLRR